MASESFIRETAKAWQLSAQEVRDVHEWVTDKVPMSYRSKVFSNLLRRKWSIRTSKDVRP